MPKKSRFKTTEDKKAAIAEYQKQYRANLSPSQVEIDKANRKRALAAFRQAHRDKGRIPREIFLTDNELTEVKKLIEKMRA